MKKVTCATMDYTDGTTSIFGVYRTVLRGRKKLFIDFNHAERVGRFQFDNGDFPGEKEYLAMAKAYENTEYPAFSF